jgi:hypothetical protein
MRRVLILGAALLAGMLVLCCGVSAIGAMVSPAPKATPSPRFAPVPGDVSPGRSASGSPGPGLSPSQSQSPSQSPSEAPSSVPALAPVPALTTEAPPPAPPAAHTTTRRVPPPPSPKPPPTTHDQYAHGVHPGAFCAPGGALGYTVAGTLMRCTTTAVDSRNRWRRA